MAHPEPTALQLAAALRTLADTLDAGVPDWLTHVVLEHCAPSMALVAKWKMTQKTERDGLPCRHCEREGKALRFSDTRELFIHARQQHRDLMAARALKAVGR